MQIPNARTPVARCETASRFAQGAMREYSTIFEAPADLAARLESLAGTLEAATAALMGRQQTYRESVLALIPLRVTVKLVDLRADEVVRSVKRAADDAGAAVSSAVFPGGVTPIIRPVGQTQAAQLRALEGRLTASSWDGAAAQLARVTAARESYEGALKRREDGMIAAADQRALRDAAKEDFLTVFAEVAAGIQQVFPRDRRRQDALFDDVHARPRRSSPDDPSPDGDDTDPTGE